MNITVTNWSKFQHYKDRTPPWIKLHKGLLNDREYLSLPVEGMAILPLIWLLASELSTDGKFETSVDLLAWRLRLDSKLLANGLMQLQDKKFIELNDIDDSLAGCYQDASGLLAGCYPRDRDRGETEKRQRKRAENNTKQSEDSRGDLVCVAKNVHLTEEETEKFVSERGKNFYLKCVDVLNNYKGSSGKKYKDDNLAIRSWVIDKVLKEHGDMREEERLIY